MNNCGKKIWLSIFMLLISVYVYAVDVVVQAPSIVAVNQRFQVSYAVDDLEAEFIKPTFSSDFKVIAGPSESVGISVFSGTGVAATASQQKIYTYYIQALKEGVFEIPVVDVKLKDGTIKKSKKTSIEVVKEAPKQGNNQPRTQTPQPADISADDLFIKMDFNRTTVYKGEPIILTVRLYAHNVPLTSLSGLQVPTFTGFDVQELQVSPNESRLHQQKYNNRVYNSAVIGRLILYPLRAGEIKLDPIEAGVVLEYQQMPSSLDPFEIMSMGVPTRTVRKQLKSAPATITIKEFPAGAPASFNGVTGNFSLTTNIDKTETTANQPLTYTVNISGTGNFNQLKEPLIAFPDKFDRYEPKITNNIKTEATGGTGNRKFEYVVIPRSNGEFEIPAFEFSYFDIQKQSYVTLKSAPVTLQIEKDPTGASQPVTTGPLVTGRKVEHLGNDIIFIKTAPVTLKPAGYVFFGSGSFWIIFAVMLVLFVLVCLLMVKLSKDKQNVALMRNKKANKVAINRLKQSAKLLKAGDRTGFYEEVSRAVWGYISDKLDMQASELSRDNVQDKLAIQNVPQENIDLLLTVIDDCEYARYAPGSNREGMEEVYNEAIQAISKLENLK